MTYGFRSNTDWEKIKSTSGALHTTTVCSTIGDGSKTVTTAGSRVALSATSVSCTRVYIVALEANTGTIWVGSNTVAAGRGRPLVALQSEILDISDLSSIYIDATVDGEGVSYAYLA
jgi:hypothetical protein